MICSTCGVVINEGKDLVLETDLDRSSLTVDRFGNRTRDSLNTPLTYPDMGLATSISRSNSDARGVALDPRNRYSLHRLRKQNKYASNRARQRNLTSALFFLNSMKDKLHLTDAAVQRSAHNYRKVLELDMAKGRSIKALIVASTYAACRELNAPKTIQEIAQTIDADALLASRCFRLLTAKLKWTPPKIEANTYVNRLANIMGIKGKAYITAMEIMNIVKKSHISQGKNPRALAAATLYVACEVENVEMSQAKIANAGEVSIVSVRKRVADIMTIYRGK
jgi:transcription initiation factor TFIIB